MKPDSAPNGRMRKRSWNGGWVNEEYRPVKGANLMDELMTDYIESVIRSIRMGNRKAVAEFEYLIRMLEIAGFGVDMGFGKVKIRRTDK